MLRGAGSGFVSINEKINKMRLNKLQKVKKTVFSSLFALLILFGTSSNVFAQEGENVLVNGNFSDGLNNWTTYVADFVGVDADFNVVDGEAAITNIQNAGGDVWHVQLFQLLSEEQKASLEIGETYDITFDARSSEDGRQLTMYFGEEGGGFASLEVFETELSTTMETYSTSAVVTSTFPQMKLGFEVGLSSADVFIDNVELVLGEAGDPGDPTPPSMPDGFQASDMVGPDPVDAGEVFLAAGPSNVGDANIEYRLFYSQTADVPANPQDATEYAFGSTPGDGNGEAAFGFRLGGLEDATEYSFWLYQYDSANDLFSEPAFASAVSGGEDDPGDPTLTPTTNAPVPTIDPDNVVSLFSDVYDNSVVTNYDPNWGQSGHGLVDPEFDPGTGNLLLAYPNFNYQGTLLEETDLSGKEFLHIDIWTMADPAETIIEVSPVNFGSGPAEVLVPIDYVQGEWTSVSIPKSAFGDMTWDAVREFKFAANGPGSVVPVDIYIDNLYFSGDGEAGDPTPPSMPDGFVASDMVGPDPVDAGEIFLAAGPSNVAEPDIEYRLFYSLSSDVPANPQDATEYEFGTTPGDGDGVNPFGFRLGGLEEATEYTFWLYQYDSANDLFSEPAVASAVSGGDGDDPAGPPTPVGFTASDMVGDDPVDDGEIFLSVGPNNVIEPNIEYRLFYSVTADAPANPQDATEYAFGSTDGDGDGVGAFGFRLGGLEESTHYTFWLYQYDTELEAFSAPAEASAVSGGEDEGGEGENVLVNGDFSDGLAAWSTFIADFAGVSADIEVVDGEASITNIEGAGGEPWWIQLNQIFTPEQIASLQVGETYEVSFDARSSEDGRPLRMYFGQEGGGFQDLVTFDINLTTSMETYSTTVVVTQTFEEMKLGFEAGLSNADVFIDNAVLILGESGDPDPIGPPTPVGFTASDMVGPDPVDDGEIFLSVGPNDVEQPNIEYRLFYSVSADAPSDPQEATEYAFGSTDGDGGGVAAFGFRLGDLEIATEYTFWLYQYDTDIEEFSDPAVASAVSGGEDDTVPLDLPVTFDDPNVDYNIVDFGGTMSQIVEDPTDSENLVVETVKTEAAETWAGTTVGGGTGFATPVPFDEENTTMSLRVWSPVADIPVRIKVEDSNDATISVETEAMVPVAEEWVTLVFNFANEAEGTSPINFENTYNMASVFFDFDTSGGAAGERTYYWDDMEFGGEADDPDPTGPSVPVGFTASDMVGEEPVGPGEIFLSAGPSDVEEENIEYRLYYSLTDEAPESPFDAAEYVFGSTPGDGEGNAAFGFVLGGLEPGEEYTFWLYQYDTDLELFSEPAEASAVSGEQDTSTLDDGDIPTEFALNQNYPNPFNPTTQIVFDMPENSNVRLDVYNLMGQLVATLVDENMNAGTHTVTFDASRLASGVYLYRLQAGSAVMTRKMTLIK